MNVNKEQLLGIGITSEDADKIIAQYNSEEVAKSFVEDVESVKEQLPAKMELPPPTINDITSITQLSEYAKGQVVRLPGFAPDQPFVARLKRPSMLALVKSGKIPNALLETASSLFDGKSKSNEATNTMGDMYEVLEIIAEASLVSPTMAEIKSAGIELTDEQFIAIFNYSQQGVEGLKSFRE
jgi:hypothetical protein